MSDSTVGRDDREYEFDVTCGRCGEVYSNVERGCPACGNGSSESYSSRDAARWNEHLRRTGR